MAASLRSRRSPPGRTSTNIKACEPDGPSRASARRPSTRQTIMVIPVDHRALDGAKNPNDAATQACRVTALQLPTKYQRLRA